MADITPPVPFFADKFAELSNGTTAYRVISPRSCRNENATPPLTVLCLHGLTNFSWIWSDLVDLLVDEQVGPGARVIVFDFHGRGLSPWNDVPCTINIFVTQTMELLEYLQIRTPLSIIAHCMGGGVATALAVKFPERVDSITLLSPLGFSMKKSLVDNSLKLYWIGECLMSGRRSVLPKRQEKEFYNYSEDSPMREFVNRHIDMVSWQIEHTSGYLASLLDTHRKFPLSNMTELYDLMGKNSRPTLFICGRDDPVIMFQSKRVMNLLDTCLPKATITRLDECGHYPMFEQFDQVATLIIDFHLDLIDKERSATKGKSVSLRVADRNYLGKE